jgi:hypothetical protein
LLFYHNRNNNSWKYNYVFWIYIWNIKISTKWG